MDFKLNSIQQRIPENFKGPLKLRYSSILKKIPIENNFFLPVLYQMTNKENNWDHESEMAVCGCRTKRMEVPLSIFRNQQKSPHNRKFPYDISALIEVYFRLLFLSTG